MKITYIVSQFPKLSETFVLGQITGLIDRGHDVEIISLSRPTEEMIHDDVNTYELLKKTHYINKSPSCLGFELNESIVSLLMFTDLIHAHFLAIPTDWAQTISRMFNIPFIVTAHAYDIFIEPELEDLQKKFQQSTKVITISDFNKNYLLDLLGNEFEDKIEVIRCGIDLEEFVYTKRVPGETTTILLVGRLVEKKGINYAIEAFSKLSKKYQNSELRIIGEGVLKDEIADQIKMLGLEDKVNLLGEQPKDVVINEIKEADIFFLPSTTSENGDREGIPVSIIEAQAMGLPVVSTIHTGIPEVIIDGKTGFLTDEKDTDAMSDKLITLANDPSLREEMGLAGRSNVEDLYDRAREIDKIEGLFKSVITYNKLLSDMPEYQLNSIKHRAKLVGDLLSRLDSEIKEYRETVKQKNDQIKQKNSEIKQKTKQLKNKDNEIKNQNEIISQMKTNLDLIKNTRAYKLYIIYVGVIKKIKGFIKANPKK